MDFDRVIGISVVGVESLQGGSGEDSNVTKGLVVCGVVRSWVVVGGLVGGIGRSDGGIGRSDGGKGGVVGFHGKVSGSGEA